MSTTAGANTRNLEKVTTSDFSSGGLLSPEQFEDFYMMVQESSTFLSRVSSEPVESDSGNLPRMGVGSRLLQGVGEGQSGTKQTPNQTDVTYQTTKVQLPWEISHEVANETIDDAEGRIRSLFTNQFAVDLEILGSVGDESLTGFEAINDGWLTIAQNSGSLAGTHNHQDDTSTAQPIDKELFGSMSSLMPERFIENNMGMAFITSHAQKQAFKEYLTDRSTGAGDAMLLTGEEPTPFGYPIYTPNGWPDDTAMMTPIENLIWVLQDEMRVKSTRSAERNVMNDYEVLMALYGKIDYQIYEPGGVVLGTNIAAPSA